MRKMYSKKQIENMALQSTLEGVKNEDVIVKTVEQTNPNWTLDLSNVQITFPSGFTGTNIFSRIQKINGELEIIFTFSITNNGDTTATPSNVQLGSFNIPSEIGSKIIDIGGDDLTKSIASEYVAIAGSRAVNSTNTSVFGGNYGILSLSHNGANKLFIAMYFLQAIAAGATHYYSARIQLTLL